MSGFGFGSLSRRSNFISLLGSGSAPWGQLQPSANWDGNPKSGFSFLPSDPTRITAKPALQLLQPPNQVFTDQLTIGAMAFANDGGNLIGGIDRLRFHFEGNTRDVVQTELRTFTRADGSNYRCPAYWVDLKRPEGSFGTAHLFIEAIPADATMQSRVIGPFPFTMSAEKHDLELEVAPSQPVIAGQRYQSLGTALFYLGVASGGSFKNPRITITEAGTYDFAGSTYRIYVPEGHVTVDASVPVSIGYASAQASDTAATARPKVDGLWFKGPNITLDFRHMLQLYNEGSKPHIFEGCKLINSGGRNTYWRKSVRPIVPVRERSYYLDCAVIEMDNATANCRLARGVTFDTTYGDIGQGAQAIVSTVANDHDAEFFAQDVPAMTVEGPAGAKLSAAGSHNGPTRDFTFKEGAAIVGTYQAKSSDAAFRSDPRDNYDVSQLVAYINTLSGWSAITLDDTRRAVVVSTLGSKGTAFTDLDVSSETTLYTMFDVHADFYQGSINQADKAENVIIYGNVGVNWVGQIMLVASRNPGNRDTIVLNNAFWTDPDNSTAYKVNAGFFSQFSNDPQSHVVFAHNSLPNQGVLLRDDLSLTFDSYSLLANNSIRSMRWASAAAGTGVITNNHVHAGANNAPQGANGTTLGGDDATLYADAITGDFAPAGHLLTNLKAPVFVYDLNGDARGEVASSGCHI